MECAPSFFSGPWDAVIAPASVFFSTQELRRRTGRANVLVYGPPHLLRAAWLAGALDYLKEPWTEDELYLRLGGARPGWLEWRWEGTLLRLAADQVSLETGDLQELSPAEAEILRVLVQRQGTPVSRAVLGWAAGCSEGRVIDTLVGRVRTKLQTLTHATANPIAPVRGLGYRLP